MDITRITRRLALAGAIVVAACFTLRLAAGNPPARAPETDPFVKKDAPPSVPTSGPIGNLVFTVEVYTTSQAEGAAILQGESSDQARYQRVLDLAKGGKAHLDNILAAACSPGGQAVVEDCGIMHYPIDWGIYQNPDGSPSAKEPPLIRDYKARNLGCRLVYKANSVSGNDAVDLTTFFENTTLRAIVNQPLTSSTFLPRPQIDTQRLNLGDVILPDGKMCFLGTATSDAAAGSGLTFVFGRMDFVPLTADSAPKPTPGALENQFSIYSMPRDRAAAILRQSPQPGSVFAAVQSLVVRNEAKLEHVAAVRGNGGKVPVDEIYEFAYPTTFHSAESTTQDTGFTTESNTKFIGNTSLVSVDLTKLQFLKYRGDLNGAIVTNAFGSAPYFELQSLVTSLNAPLGENEFVGTISPPGNVGITVGKPDDDVWFAFVKTIPVSP